MSAKMQCVTSYTYIIRMNYDTYLPAYYVHKLETIVIRTFTLLKVKGAVTNVRPDGKLK